MAETSGGGGWGRGSEQLRLGSLPASSVSCVPNPHISCVYSCKSSKTAPVAHEALRVLSLFITPPPPHFLIRPPEIKFITKLTGPEHPLPLATWIQSIFCAEALDLPHSCPPTRPFLTRPPLTPCVHPHCSPQACGCLPHLQSLPSPQAPASLSCVLWTRPVALDAPSLLGLPPIPDFLGLGSPRVPLSLWSKPSSGGSVPPMACKCAHVGVLRAGGSSGLSVGMGGTGSGWAVC